MECNREDAAKAIKIAEEKMLADDFVGAQKFVTKAQRLFPNLENIPQMAAICDVHSSAINKIKGLDDWYGILQVQAFADADTIKKQYRKLAFLLHPDKNKFAGAEAAFKLIGEANRMLSDLIKRSHYDIRYRSHSILASRHNANLGRHCAAANNIAENIASVYTFWTRCRHCGHCYKYLREYMNTVMHCSICRKSYLASNTRCDEVPPSSSTAGKKEFQDHGMCNTSRQNVSTRADSGSSAAAMDKNGTVGGEINKKNQENQKRGSADREPEKDESFSENDAVGRIPQNDKSGTNNSAEIPKANVLKPQHEVKEPDTSAEKKNQAAKKRKRSVEKSSKSFEVDSSDVAGAKTDTSHENNKRNSSRKKPHASYTKKGSNVDFFCPPKIKTKSGCEFEFVINTKHTGEDNKSPELADSGVSSASSHAYKVKAKNNANSGNEDILSAKNKESEGCDGNREDAAFSSNIDRVQNGCKANENPHMLDIPDPEFNVFEVERQIGNFAVNQVWSTTDSRDGMPRKYAQITKVLNGEFRLQITYLEPERDEIDESIPVACGKFKNGKTAEVEDHSIFSSQMHHWLCNEDVFIYPRKGEIWALFRDWDEEWSTNLKKHNLPYRYVFVEVVNDFHNDDGVGVAYLGKLEGSVPLFHREALNDVCQVQFCPEEIRRFSHKVPAVKTTGKERECVPADSYKLDPAALPKAISQVDAVHMEMNSGILNDKADFPYPEALNVEVKASVPETGPFPRKRRKIGNLEEVKGETSRSNDLSSCRVDEKNTPKKFRKIGEAANVFKLRKSPRLQTNPSQQRDEKESAKQGNKMKTPKKTDKGLMIDSLRTRKSPNGIHQTAESQGESLKKQGCNGEMPSLSPKTTLASSNCKTAQRNAFDFKNQRSEDKFQDNQIWAVYSKNMGMPSEYVKIKKIETKPEFVLRVTHTELYPPSKEPVTRPVSCGEFKLKNGRPKILPRASFSHQVKPFDSKKSIVKVYPRKGEIWALYKNCDSTAEKHDIVEVVEDDCDGKIVKVVALTAKDSSSLYMTQRKQGSTWAFIEIPKAEMSRFSHQIPAVRHEKRKTRLADEGYWELDPIAIPGRTR